MPLVLVVDEVDGSIAVLLPVPLVVLEPLRLESVEVVPEVLVLLLGVEVSVDDGMAVDGVLFRPLPLIVEPVPLVVAEVDGVVSVDDGVVPVVVPLVVPVVVPLVPVVVPLVPGAVPEPEVCAEAPMAHTRAAAAAAKVRLVDSLVIAISPVAE